jgi:osmotically-inducible protein OsmY
LHAIRWIDDSWIGSMSGSAPEGDKDMQFRSWIGAGALAGVLLAASVPAALAARQGTAEKLGKNLDQLGKDVKRGVGNVADDLRAQFAKTRDAVNAWGVEARVYGRLHWDSALDKLNLETHVDRAGVAPLRGEVPDEIARAKAVTLAHDTVGVTKVVDQLSVVASPVEKPVSTDAP